MQKFQVILDAVSVPVVVLNTSLDVVVANSKSYDAFPDMAPGMGISSVIGRKPRLISLLTEVLQAPQESAAFHKATMGKGREFLVLIRKLQVDGGQYLVLTFEDRSPLLDAKTMRSDFVANVSHEIRSPLTSISGFVETLQGSASEDPEARALFLGLMAKEAQRMTNLVADLLSLSQVEVKERRALKKTTDLNAILDQSFKAVAYLAEKRGKSVEFQPATTLPAVLGKEDDLVRIFINLLENALNYSAEGSTVTMRAEIAPKNNPLRRPAICVTIKDQGEGIPAAEIPRLTERFYRIDKSRSRDVGGTGLGLAIVKHILVRHRGKLLIESTPGEGSTFTICLPVAASKNN